MKRLFIVAICSTLFFACGNSTTQQRTPKGENSVTAKVENTEDGGVIRLTTEEFTKRIADISRKEWKYLGDKPAIIDFYADWCGPCRMIAPTIEKIAQKYNGELYIYKVNIDDNPELAQRFRISAIPTIMFIPQKGEPVTERGVIGMDGFEKYIKEVLLK